MSDRSQRPLAFAELEPRYDRDLRAWATLSPLRALHTVVRRSVALLNARTDADASADESACPYDGLAEFCYEGKLAVFESARPSDGRARKSRRPHRSRGARRRRRRHPPADESRAAESRRGPAGVVSRVGVLGDALSSRGRERRTRMDADGGRERSGVRRASRVLAEVGVLLAEGTREGGALEGRSGGVLTPRLRSGTPYYPGLRSTASRTRWKETSPEASGFDSNGLFSEGGYRRRGSERRRTGSFSLSRTQTSDRPANATKYIYITRVSMYIRTAAASS